MGTVRIRIDPNDPATLSTGWIDEARVDASTEEDIARHIAEDEAEAERDAAQARVMAQRPTGVTTPITPE